MRVLCQVIAMVALVTLQQASGAGPTVGETTVIGPFTGPFARLHPDNIAPLQIQYYGTDLGWTYEHDGKLHLLFGDTAANEKGEPIQASTKGIYDDSFGTIDLTQWRDPSQITPTNIPLIRIGQNPGTTETAAMDPGQAMEQFKTPIGGFSNGRDQFGIFYTSKQLGCRVDADCPHELTCDTGLGYLGEKYDDEKGLTVACIDGSPYCNADTMTADGKPVSGTGFCSDRTSSAWADTPIGRISGVAVKNVIGLRSTTDPRNYSGVAWLTNKYSNSTVRTVQDFVPTRGSSGQDYGVADGTGGNQRVFYWARPGFVGVGARGRPMALYFAYTDMPAGPGIKLKPYYFTGVDAKGVPQFSEHEKDAAAADMDSTQPGIQGETLDIVDQVSVAWVAPLKKWVMFFGGGMINRPSQLLPDCGVVQLFAREECKDVVIGNAALRMRTADDPWGPWTPAQDLLVAGDPAKPELQYGPGGILHHPDCTAATCAGATQWQGIDPREYGFLYGANIIEQWIKPAGDGVDVIWNASTWDPYRIVLLRTHIRR